MINEKEFESVSLNQSRFLEFQSSEYSNKQSE